MEKRYHLIPANFEIYNFDDLINEYNKYNYILWPNGKENKKYCNNYNKGDIVYIYCTNLPDYTNRILIKGEILEADPIEKDIYSYDNEKYIKGFKLENIKPISLREKDKFSFANLKNKYRIKLIKNHRYLNKNDDLVKDIERCARNCHNSFPYIKEYFDTNVKCACKSLGKIEHHKSFIKENGFVYYEIHHLIMQNNTNKVRLKTEKYLNEKFNKIILCPICHRKIHYGKIDERKAMVKHLYLRNKKEINNVLRSIAKGKEFEWLFKQYLSESEKEKFKDYSIN